MLDQLHNEIDRLEELRERAVEVARTVGRDVLVQALASGQVDIPTAMMAASKAVEAEMAVLTTKAFSDGVKFSRERANADKDAPKAKG